MKFHYSAFLYFGGILIAPIAVLSQELPRTEFGYPNFQGYWNNLYQTPLQRPIGLGEKRRYTDEEAIALVNQALQELDARASQLDPDRAPPEPCLLYTSPSPRDRQKSRMPSSA